MVKMFYNIFFINFDNQNDRELDLSKKRNPASFFSLDFALTNGNCESQLKHK